MKILVLGGGPAGATAARLLAKNFEVTLIRDKDWDKPCGGGTKIKVFDEFNISKDIIKHLLDFVEVKYKNKKIKVDLKGKNLAIIIRKEFDKTLRDLAKQAGVEIIYGKFKNFENKKAVININNKKELFDYDILIAADGVNSTVRKAINLPPVPKIITYYSRIENYKINTCEFFFDKKLGGDYYAWAFPHVNKIHIGSVGATFDNLCKYLNIQTKPKGYFIPTWQENITIQKDNIYFIGDAAGQVMPLSFEGIYYAINSAKILANSIINNLNYTKEWDKRFKKEFKFMKTLENMMKKNILRDILIKAQSFNKIQNISVNLWLGKGFK